MLPPFTEVQLIQEYKGGGFSPIERPLVTNSKVIYLDTVYTYVQFGMIHH